MDDQFSKDDKVDYEVSPESGPGQEAADFRAPQEKQFLGGGGSEQPPKPEASKPTPTEASKGFFGNWYNNKLKPELKFLTNTFPGQQILYGGLLGLAYVAGSEIPGDIARGDYRGAAVRGVIAGLSAAPAVIKGIKMYRNI